MASVALSLGVNPVFYYSSLTCVVRAEFACKLDDELDPVWQQIGPDDSLKHDRCNHSGLPSRPLYRVDRLPAADRRRGRRTAVTAQNYLGVEHTQRASETNIASETSIDCLINGHRASKRRTGGSNPVMTHP